MTVPLRKAAWTDWQLSHRHGTAALVHSDMTGPLELVFYALWIAHPILQGLLCIEMVRRKLVSRWPNFFTYTAAQIFFFLIEFAARPQLSEDHFFYLSCISGTLSVAFGFRAIEEVYRDVFRVFDALRDLGTLLFRWVGLLMVLVAVVVAASSSSTDLLWISHSILILERSLRVMQCGIILFLLVFIRHLGLTWRSRSFGVAFGFGIMALAATIVSLLEVRGGASTSYELLSLINVAAYNVAILTWIAYMLMPAEAGARAGSALRTKRWEQELREIRADASGETLIPRFESLVERALSRTEDEAEPVRRR